MDVVQQVGLPVLGIVAAAALTFYAVSFNELREVRIYRRSNTGSRSGMDKL